MWLFCFLVVFEYILAQENLSPNGTATQSTTYTNNDGTWSADLAIDDGGPTHEWTSFSCTHTKFEQTISRVWWMVSFSKAVYVSNVVIYYRKDNPGRLAGYSLYVSNTRISNNDIDFSTGHLCYHHNGNDYPDILQNVTCNKLGNNVIIYNERLPGVTYPSIYITPPVLELCDVQVIGCKKGFSGEGCSLPCPKYCIDNHCNPTTRECIWGCTSSKCRENVCVHEGKCIYGCPHGFAGLFCDKSNIAISKTAVLLVTEAVNQTEYLVTDGDKRETSCVRLMGQTNWIQIDTEHQHAVTDLYITLKDSPITATLKIYVTNSSGDLAKPINITTQDLNIITDPLLIYEYRISPVNIGRYVIISFFPFVVNSFMNICEVEIIGTLIANTTDENTTQKMSEAKQIENNENKYLIPLVVTSVTSVVFCLGFVVVILLLIRKTKRQTNTGKEMNPPVYETTLKETSMDIYNHKVKNKYSANMTNISEYEEIPADKRINLTDISLNAK